MSTLLEKALAVNRRASSKEIPDEEIELALAWLQDGVSNGAVATAIGKNPSAGSEYSFLATRIKAAFRNGKLRVGQ